MLVFFTNLSLLECQVRYLALFHLFSLIDVLKWFWMGSLCKNIQSVLEFFKAPFHSRFYIFPNLPDDVICNIAIYADDTTLYSSGIRHLICGNKSIWLLNLNLMYEALWTWAGSGLLITILEKLNFLV